MKKKIININVYLILVILSTYISSCRKENVNELNMQQFNKALNYGEVFDIDSNKYATIKIGQQTWMAENLRTSRYANGDTIQNCTEALEWINLTSGSWAHFNNNSSFNLLHGKLYNWYAVNDQRNICPTGWHVPSDEEWSLLLNFLGGSNSAGHKLKSRLNGAWATEYQGQTGVGHDPSNESGFSAIASGSRGTNGQFILMTYRGSFWSTMEYNTTEAFYREIFWNGDGIGRYNDKKTDGYSCRCIKD